MSTHRKSSYLRRLLMIYIGFFALLACSFLFDFLPSLSQGVSSGIELGNEINEAYQDEEPKQFYMVLNIPLNGSEGVELTPITADTQITAYPTTIALEVTEPMVADQGVNQIAFAAIGNSPLTYILMIGSALCFPIIVVLPLTYILMIGSALCFPIIVVLMFLIIRSVRRSIREEEPLAKRNALLLRAIALLTILSELLGKLGLWQMAKRAAALLAESDYVVDTTFHLNYGILLMGLLLLFSAEIFVIGRDLGEEQKLTI